MQIPKIPITFPNFVKYPLQAVTYMLLLYFVYKEFTKPSDPCRDLRETLARQEERINALEMFNMQLIKSNDDFKNALLVKNGIIDRVQNKLDSIKTSTP